MFQDALVESAGRLQSKSRYWMLATLPFNLLLLAAAMLLPLLHPEALPRTALTALLIAPPPPAAPAPKAAPPQVTRAVRVTAPLDPMTVPTHVPRTIDRDHEPPPVAAAGIAEASMVSDGAAASPLAGALAINTTPVIVTRQPETVKPTGPAKVSSGVMAGAVLTKTQPVYPAIAKAARVSGAVVLHAIISKAGTIESLQVTSGPEMLRASALDAVRQWRYRPYLLNGEPTEVDTAVTVNFSFSPL